jgi:hypothetical protein
MMPMCPLATPKNEHVPWAIVDAAGHVQPAAPRMGMMPVCPLATPKNEHVPPGEMFTGDEFLALALTEC